jgi:hypothetical protein
MSATAWLSVPDIAARLDASATDIERVLTDLDLTESRAHSRVDDGVRVYSPALVRLVGRTLASRTRVSADDPVESLAARLEPFDVSVRSFAGVCLCFDRRHGRADCPQHRPRPEPRSFVRIEGVGW